MLARLSSPPVMLLAALALAGCTARAADSETGVESLDAELAGGRVTKSYPAVGYLAGRADDYSFCTATLVEASYIVTAAHCVKGVRATTLAFGTGAVALDGRRVNLTRCVSNPKFRAVDDATGVYDFAFCELAKPIKDVSPLAFALTPSVSASYLALGYGQTDADDEDSSGPRKQLAVQRVVDEEEDDMLAVVSTRGSTCFGDSGGPLLVVASNGTARVAGVLSSGIAADGGDCSNGSLNYYARASKNAAFFATR